MLPSTAIDTLLLYENEMYYLTHIILYDTIKHEKNNYFYYLSIYLIFFSLV
jgi:hypothetical protein